jgi:hypothetical protein
MFDPPEYINKYNRDKHNYWFLVSFSLLSIVLHILPISRDIHNILYSANVFSLIGFTIIIAFYPYRLYNYYSETFRNIITQIGLSRVVELNVYLLLIIAWIVHVIPVYVLRNKYSFGNPISWILLYFVFAGPFLGKIYNLTFHEITGVFIGTSVLFIAIYIFDSRVRERRRYEVS